MFLEVSDLSSTSIVCHPPPLPPFQNKNEERLRHLLFQLYCDKIKYASFK